MFPKKDPGKGSGQSATWTFEKWKEVHRRDGWITGEPVWLDTHFYFVTHPCHSFLSSGKLPCPHCQRGRRLEEGAYFPWIDDTGKPFASFVKSYQRRALEKLRPGDPVTVGKGKVKFDPVWVKGRPHAPQWVPSEGCERTPEQFERWLLVLWKSPELFAHFGVDNPVTLRPAADTSPITETPATEMRRERALLQYQNWLAGKASKPDDEQLKSVGESFPNLRAFRDRAEANGKPNE